jgi:hypothetical protein
MTKTQEIAVPLQFNKEQMNWIVTALVIAQKHAPTLIHWENFTELKVNLQRTKQQFWS